MGLFNLKKNIEDLETNIDTTRSDLETNITTTQSTLQTNIDNTRSDLSVIEDNFSAGKDFIKASSIPNDSITTDKIHSNTITQEKIHGGGITPTGTILPFASETPPAGWLLCDGSTISRANYPDLFAVCGETYGAGDGSTTFTIPDLADRIPVGKGSTKTSLGAKGGAVDMTPSGSLSGGGVDNATLSNQQLPAHNHGGGSHSHTFYNHENTPGCYHTTSGNHNWYNPRTGSTSASGTIIGSCGCGYSHGHTYHNPSFTGNSMSVEQPYTVLNYIIKY